MHNFLYERLFNERRINDKAWLLHPNGSIIGFSPLTTHGDFIKKNLSLFNMTKSEVVKWAESSDSYYRQDIHNKKSDYNCYYRYAMQFGKAVKLQYTENTKTFGIEGKAELIDKYRGKLLSLMLDAFAEYFLMTITGNLDGGENDLHELLKQDIKLFKLNPKPSTLAKPIGAVSDVSQFRKLRSGLFEGMLVEMPYIFDDNIPGGGLDLEWERMPIGSLIDLSNQIAAIFSGNSFTDKYGNSVKLETNSDKKNFAKKIVNDKMTLNFAKSRFNINPSFFKKLVKEILDQNMLVEESIVTEGGNVFKDDSMIRIPRKNVIPTVQSLEKILKMDLTGNLLGSTGKAETSGDMDIAVDSHKYNKDDIFNRLITWCKDNDLNPKEYVSKSGISVHFKTEIVGMPGKFVQTDLMFVDDIDFAKFAISSNEKVPGLKGMHRNILLSAFAKNKNMSWSNAYGLKDRTTGEIVENKNPDNVAKILLANTKAKANDLTDVRTILQKSLEYGTFKSIDELKQSLEEARNTILKSSPVDIFTLLPNTNESTELNEAAQAGFRTGVQHLYSEYKPDEYSMSYDNFKVLLERLKSIGGVINSSNTKMSEKADGVALKFGITNDGKFFTQGSYSGVVTDGNFEGKIKHEPTKNAFTENFIKLKALVYPTLKKYTKANGLRIHSEWLYVPLGKHDDSGSNITFVATSYRKQDLGSESTLLIIRVTDFDDQPISSTTSNQIITSLEQLSNKDIKILPLDIDEIPSINLTQLVNKALTSIKKFESENPDFETIISNPSRKRPDQEAKRQMNEKITKLILPYEKAMHDVITKSLSKYSGKLGGYEGIVITIKDFVFKVINTEFHKAKGRI